MKRVFWIGLALTLWLAASTAIAQGPDNSPSSEPHRGLPFLWDRIPLSQRADFPSPYGFSIHHYHQNQTLNFVSADITADGMPLPPTMVQVQSINESCNAMVARFDAWVLPFLNAYVHAATFGGSVSKINVQSVLPIDIPQIVSYDGNNYGFGLTGIYGVKDYFVTYDMDWTWTDQDMVVGKGRTLDQGVRIGKRAKKWTAYTGWAKQEIRGHRAGSTELEDGMLVEFDVKVAPARAWTWLAGAQYSPAKEWDINLEMAFGNRKSTMLSATRRF